MTVDIPKRKEIEARAVELLLDHPDYQLLTTIPGISPINAMKILAEAGDLRRFRHHRQFLNFCGMDLATVQPGLFRGQTRISKYENAGLRRTLWMAGQTAVLKRINSFRNKLERYISKDRHSAHLRHKAYTAVAPKDGADSSKLTGRSGKRYADIVDNVRAFCLGFRLALRTVRAAIARTLYYFLTADLVWATLSGYPACPMPC